jgi:hypothetical protein
MLALYGLMCVFVIVFFSIYALISIAYLIGVLLKRRYTRVKPVTRDRWALPQNEVAGFKSLAKGAVN